MRPLEGIRIIDLTTFLAAPASVRVLGEWGADIIKVEAPNGDPARTQASVFHMPYSDEENVAFDVANMNKRFITINLKNPAGRKVLFDLLATADVFVTNNRTKALQRLGISYDDLKERFPLLIYAQILGYGDKGPEKDAPGFDATAYVCRGGLLGSMHERGETPINAVNGFGDFQASFCLASGILAALIGREKTGRGDRVTVSLQHTALFMMNIGVVSSQYGNRYPKSRREVPCPTNCTYKTKDGRWLVICIPEYDKNFNKVMRLIGREDLADHPRYGDLNHVNAHGLTAEIVDIISDEFARMTVKEAVTLFKSADFAIEPGVTPDEILEDEQAWANDALRRQRYPSGNDRIVVTTPVRFRSVGDAPLKITAAQGSNTLEILEESGYSGEDIERLLEDGAVEGVKRLLPREL